MSSVSPKNECRVNKFNKNSLCQIRDNKTGIMGGLNHFCVAVSLATRIPGKIKSF